MRRTRNGRAPDTNDFAHRHVQDEQRLQEACEHDERNWSKWLDRIGDHFGELRIAQFDRPDKIRPVIRRWRNQWADKPRTADYGMQVLSRVLSHAVDPLGKIAGNPCEGMKQLYSSDRSEIIWTASDIAALKTTCSLRSPMPSISPPIPACVSVTCCAYRGRTSVRTRSR